MDNLPLFVSEKLRPQLENWILRHIPEKLSEQRFNLSPEHIKEITNSFVQDMPEFSNVVTNIVQEFKMEHTVPPTNTEPTPSLDDVNAVTYVPNAPRNSFDSNPPALDGTNSTRSYNNARSAAPSLYSPSNPSGQFTQDSTGILTGSAHTSPTATRQNYVLETDLSFKNSDLPTNHSLPVPKSNTSPEILGGDDRADPLQPYPDDPNNPFYSEWVNITGRL
jgi:hypothetical protein